MTIRGHTTETASAIAIASPVTTPVTNRSIDRTPSATASQGPGCQGRLFRHYTAGVGVALGMHLYWNMDDAVGPLVEASVVLEILEPPTVAKTYFWALQASFTDADGTDHGAAHLGLQWYPPHPNAGAVNWGGYPPQNDNWKVTLTGSESPLPSTTDDPNTRDYPWQVGVPYRLRIFRSPDKGWRATITDMSTGTVDLVRDLWLGGNQLRSLIVWTEWFCGRRDPLVSVRWSEYVAVDSYGVAHAPVSVLVNHPAEGFRNTSHVVEESGPHAKILQVMKTRRKVPHGTLIPVGGSPLGLPTDPFSDSVR